MKKYPNREVALMKKKEEGRRSDLQNFSWILKLARDQPDPISTSRRR